MIRTVRRSNRESGRQAEGLMIVLLIGVTAAALIPAQCNEMHRARQKRTVADMRWVAAALDRYEESHGQYPAGDSLEGVRHLLEPTFVGRLPTRDGWGRELRYECWPEEDQRDQCRRFALASAGRDGRWERESLRGHEATAAEAGDADSVDRDVVLIDGNFVGFQIAPSPWLLYGIAGLVGIGCLGFVLFLRFGGG